MLCLLSYVYILLYGLAPQSRTLEGLCDFCYTIRAKPNVRIALTSDAYKATIITIILIRHIRNTGLEPIQLAPNASVLPLNTNS